MNFAGFVFQHLVPRVLQCFQVALKMLDACPGSAAELQREDFDRQIFHQLREDTPDQSNYPVGGPLFLILSTRLVFDLTSCRLSSPPPAA